MQQFLSLVDKKKLVNSRIRFPCEARYGHALYDFDDLEIGQLVLAKWAEDDVQCGADLSFDRYWQCCIVFKDNKSIVLAICGDIERYEEVHRGNGSQNASWTWHRDLIEKKEYTMLYSLDRNEIMYNVHRGVETYGAPQLSKKILQLDGVMARRRSFEYAIYPSDAERLQIIKEVIRENPDVDEKEWPDDRLNKVWESTTPVDENWEPPPYQFSKTIRQEDIRSEVCAFVLHLPRLYVVYVC